MWIKIINVIMPKTVIKYITKPTEELISYISINRNIKSEIVNKELKELLISDNFFGLVFYEFGKISGVIYFDVDKETLHIFVKFVLFLYYKNLSLIINFLRGKFENYRIVFDTKILDSHIIPILKKIDANYDGTSKYIINL